MDTDAGISVLAGQVWVHCATGYHAAIGASLLDRHDRDVVLVGGEFENAEGHRTRS